MLVEGDKGVGEEGGRRAVTFWIPGRGNEKLQVRKKNEEDVIEGAGGEEGAAIFVGDRCQDWLSNSAGAGVT